MNAINREQLAELAALYTAGLLPAGEADQFEDRLNAGDSAALAEFRRISPAADLLVRAATSVEPTLIARSNLINALGLPTAPAPFANNPTSRDPSVHDPLAMVLFRADDLDWQQTAVPGAKVRNLYVDRARNRATLLIKLEPGTVFPDHEHPDAEECLVLEGDLELGGKVLHRFDYMRIPKGGQHGTPRTTNGCIVLVTCGIAA